MFHDDNDSRSCTAASAIRDRRHDQPTAKEIAVMPMHTQDNRLRPIRRIAPVCQICQKRPALACVRGIWRVLKDHDICRQCWRGYLDSRVACRAR
jgi:hypothetical protein